MTIPAPAESTLMYVHRDEDARMYVHTPSFSNLADQVPAWLTQAADA